MLKRTIMFGCLFVIIAGLVEASDLKPNIVVIMADDIGLGDISFHNREILKREPVVETPNIDALARDGMWFKDGHSSTALCSPTRYCMMSGNNNYRSYAPWGIWQSFRPSAFSGEQVTLGSVAREAGYKTGFIGKWHLGGDFYIKESTDFFRGSNQGHQFEVDLNHWISNGPREVGFDYDFTLPCGIQGPLYLAYENKEWYPLTKDSEIIFVDKHSAKDPVFLTSKGPGMGDSKWDTKEIPGILSQKAVDFIKRQSADEPFMLYYCSPIVHLPHCPPDMLNGMKIAGATQTPHMDMIRVIDIEVGRIVEALKEKGVYENTLIIFTSDNGGLEGAAKSSMKYGHDASGGWRGSKNTPYEGGHRVPFVVIWPNEIEARSITEEPVINHDVLATIAAIVKTELAENEAMDSLNLLPLLTGEGKFIRRESMLLQAGSNKQLVFRKGNWKLIIQSNADMTKWDAVGLFNLKKNPTENESENLINHPEYEARAEEMLNEYLIIRSSGIRTAPLNQI